MSHLATRPQPSATTTTKCLLCLVVSSSKNYHLQKWQYVNYVKRKFSLLLLEQLKLNFLNIFSSNNRAHPRRPGGSGTEALPFQPLRCVKTFVRFELFWGRGRNTWAGIPLRWGSGGKQAKINGVVIFSGWGGGGLFAFPFPFFPLPISPSLPYIVIDGNSFFIDFG